nr:NSP4 [Bat rotavirus]
MEPTMETKFLDGFEVNDSPADTTFTEDLGKIMTEPTHVFNLMQHGKIQEYFANTPLEKIGLHAVMLIISFCGIQAQSRKILYCTRMLFWKIKVVIEGLVRKCWRQNSNDLDQIIKQRITEYSRSIEAMISNYNKKCAESESALSFNGLNNFVESIKNEFNVRVAEMERKYDELRWRCETIANHNMNNIILSQNSGKAKQEQTYIFDDGSLVQYSRD